GSISLCLCLAVLSVVGDAPFFPNPFLLIFAFQTMASSLALLVVTVPMACVIAMDQPYFLHPKFIDIPGHLFTFFLFFILSTQFCITLRRIVRTWSEETVDAVFKQCHLLHIQLGFATLFSMVATVFLSKRESVSYFNHSLMAWRINKMDWYITCGFCVVFAVVLILLNLPTLRLMWARRRRSLFSLEELVLQFDSSSCRRCRTPRAILLSTPNRIEWESRGIILPAPSPIPPSIHRLPTVAHTQHRLLLQYVEGFYPPTNVHDTIVTINHSGIGSGPSQSWRRQTAWRLTHFLALFHVFQVIFIQRVQHISHASHLTCLSLNK
ncbi:hypothetical protein PRIPAC_76287, partial [Pristionchus pacificus]|uniref:Uncharacterized protein n=1 Tax=Pristionchus pacificus TaxID=54126 RepID=A0A8R1V5G1_PRIPA